MAYAVLVLGGTSYISDPTSASGSRRLHPGNHNRRHLPHGQGLQCYKVAGLRIGPTVEIISVRD